MASTIPKTRLKKRHSKTRTGCSTCKRRHFKCDERKPECLRCMVDGKPCEYNIPQTKLFPPSHSDDSTPGLLQVPDTSDPSEQRALHYFREKTICDLSGFTTYTRAFWNSVIPGLSQAEPAIRHIAIALASQHEAQRADPEDRDKINRFCFKHHSIALHHLSRSLPAQKEEVLLVSCIAFIAFERFRDPDGVHGNYLDYAISGLKILREREEMRLRTGNGGAFNLVDDFVEPMLFQIEIIFTMFCDPVRIMLNDLPEADPEPPSIAAEFSDIAAACDAIFRIIVYRYIIVHRNEAWSNTSCGFLTVRGLMGKWYRSLSALQAKIPDNDVEQFHKIEALRKQIRVLSGAILYSVRDDIPAKTLCRPTLVYLSLPDKLTIFTGLDRNRKVNLSGMNGTLYPWPHAKRVSGPDGRDSFIALEFTASGMSS